MKKDYFDNVLIKLRRVYSTDETVAALSKKLTEKDIEIGQLKAEVDYFNSQFDQEIKKETLIQIRKEELYKAQCLELTKLRKDIKKLKQIRDTLICKIAATK
jgi:predicted RNase H-like nuclease (RuvC/YqgF family)